MKIDITKWKDKIIENTCELINIPSVYEKSTNPKTPFGKENAKALKQTLDFVVIAETTTINKIYQNAPAICSDTTSGSK